MLWRLSLGVMGNLFNVSGAKVVEKEYLAPHHKVNILEPWRKEVRDLINDGPTVNNTWEHNSDLSVNSNKLSDIFQLLPSHHKIKHLTQVMDKFDEYISEVFTAELTECEIPFNIFTDDMSMLEFIIILQGYIGKCGKWNDPWKKRIKKRKMIPEVYIIYDSWFTHHFSYTLDYKRQVLILDPTELLQNFDYYVKIKN